MATERIVGLSQWEQEMYGHLLSHGEVEGAILDEYKRLAEDDRSSPAFRYLVGMILEDEVRHHKLFGDLAEAIRSTGELRPTEESIPPIHGLHADRDRILETTERLLEAERADAKELKHLLKEFKDFRDTTLWSLLVELMRDDTAKHIKILEFIRDRAEKSPF